MSSFSEKLFWLCLFFRGSVHAKLKPTADSLASVRMYAYIKKTGMFSNAYAVYGTRVLGANTVSGRGGERASHTSQ